MKQDKNRSVNAFEVYTGATVRFHASEVTCATCKKVHHNIDLVIAATWEYRTFQDGIERRRFLIDGEYTLPCGHASSDLWIAAE